jgi:hypothetical protein
MFADGLVTKLVFMILQILIKISDIQTSSNY